MKIKELTASQVRRWSLACLGTIVLGAIGSGVWQSLLGPILHVSTRGLLDLASLGFVSYKNSVYRQVAADNQFAVDVGTLSLSTNILFFAIIVLAAIMMYQMREVKRLTARILGQTDVKPTTDPHKYLIYLKIIRAFAWAWALIGVGVVFQLFINQARLSYVASADAHYHQVVRIVSPYVDAGELTKSESDFAQIASRQDYVAVLSKLEGIARAHSKKLPEFDPW